MISIFREEFFVIIEGVAADHHAKRCPWIEIPFSERHSLSGVERFSLNRCPIIGGELSKFAQICRDGITGRISDGF